MAAAPHTSPDSGDRAAPRHTFRPHHRLTHNREFQAVYDARLRKSRAGIMLFSLPTSLPCHRLGLAVSSRTIPRAVDRNRAKRLIREAFRLSQHTLARTESGRALDLVVSVRTDRLPPLSALITLLADLTAECAAEWSRRDRRAAAPPA